MTRDEWMIVVLLAVAISHQFRLRWLERDVKKILANKEKP